MAIPYQMSQAWRSFSSPFLEKMKNISRLGEVMRILNQYFLLNLIDKALIEHHSIHIVKILGDFDNSCMICGIVLKANNPGSIKSGNVKDYLCYQEYQFLT